MIVVHLGTGERRKAYLVGSVFFYERPDGSSYLWPDGRSMNWASRRLEAGDLDFELPESATDWALSEATREDLVEIVWAGFGGLISRSSALVIVED
jgi:hypothetical protein